MKTKLIVSHIPAPLARIPGFAIKENQVPYVPVAVVMMNDRASPASKRQSRAYAGRMAAAPELYEAVAFSLPLLEKLIRNHNASAPLDTATLLIWREHCLTAKEWADTVHPEQCCV